MFEVAQNGKKPVKAYLLSWSKSSIITDSIS